MIVNKIIKDLDGVLGQIWINKSGIREVFAKCKSKQNGKIL